MTQQAPPPQDPSAGNRGPSTCASCGAPDDGEAVVCKFCKQAVSAEVQRTAIPCPNPNCRTPCRWGRQKCHTCQGWIVVQCVFCGALSPHNCSTCMRCNEAFAGAPERKAQRDAQQQQQQQQQQMHQQVSTWGPVAAAFVGAAAGSAVTHRWGGGYDYSHHHVHYTHHHESYDTSNVWEESPPSSGGDWDNDNDYDSGDSWDGGGSDDW